MTTLKFQYLAKLTRQLAEILRTAAICAEEIRFEINTEFNHTQPIAVRPDKTKSPDSHRFSQRPILDQSTLCVTWKDKSVHLGYTRVFRLLDRLSRCPNQYVTHLELLQDVWDDENLSDATIRSVVRHLRSRLRSEGMEELAARIRGHNGRYILKL